MKISMQFMLEAIIFSHIHFFTTSLRLTFSLSQTNLHFFLKPLQNALKRRNNFIFLASIHSS